MLNKKRKDYLADIIRYGVNAEIIVPTTILKELTIEPDSFKIFRDSLQALQEDEGLIVTLTDLEDGLTSIDISLKPDNNTEEETTNTDG